ncbi:hypothetical protein KAFR_0A03110 [Kazachstania africana CBS 2517]|uniref:Mediator of RNA polymerase II transcription subunit 10 n=1 Tax=Kazachstania africana (strain ATCC 22294 / BCRC 22015 / CBS 2517 / CECT 1963 / NBRC 1671 / NRRL Y-8276) TaxID=1071382 RepID=H2AMZ6_KAZAF|nr:hypothetical protein KAFR_0A03110 [Kazachstania africana CBS 2517]CCF55746.1 hypothetical protein KAFR_0A03110 [Kazachstania africana CBS 2517]
MSGEENELKELHVELDTTEQQVASIIESFIELGVSVYDFPGTREATQGMITNLKRNVDRLFKLNQRSNDPDSHLNKTNIPLEVVQYIEDGRNPDIYTREFVEAIRRSNQYQRAKMHGLKQLRDSLAEKIIEEFPDLTDKVDSIIQRTNAKQTGTNPEPTDNHKTESSVDLPTEDK